MGGIGLNKALVSITWGGGAALVSGLLAERAYFIHKVFLLYAVRLTFHVFFVRSATWPASWDSRT
jgi:hypothetical protein